MSVSILYLHSQTIHAGDEITIEIGWINSNYGNRKTKNNFISFYKLTSSPRVDEAESVGYDF